MFALVGAGRVTDSFVARIPRLSLELGPVAAQSYRLASRIANAIGAGHPVRGYQDLEPSRLVLLCAPAAQLPVILPHLIPALDWRGKVALLCDSGADSTQLAGLRARGAAAGSIQPIRGFERRFVAEGDRAAVRAAKRLASLVGGRVEEVRTERIGLYRAALSFSTCLFIPLMEAAYECLRGAGIDDSAAMRITEQLFHQSVRGYHYSGKRSWSGVVAKGDSSRVWREIDALAEVKPHLAHYYCEGAAFALDYFGRHPALRESLVEPRFRAHSAA